MRAHTVSTLVLLLLVLFGCAPREPQPGEVYEVVNTKYNWNGTPSEGAVMATYGEPPSYKINSMAFLDKGDRIEIIEKKSGEKPYYLVKVLTCASNADTKTGRTLSIEKDIFHQCLKLVED
jgi:hypothetical protein